MSLLKLLRSVGIALGVIAIVFIVASIFDIIMAVIHTRFYSNLAFIVIFGVAGIFAALLSYTYAIGAAVEKNQLVRWTIIITNIIAGLAFAFPLAAMEGGEYEAAFRSYGITLGLGTLFFARLKLE